MPKVHFGKNGGAYVMKAGKKKYLSQFGTGIEDLPPELRKKILDYGVPHQCHRVDINLTRYGHNSYDVGIAVNGDDFYQAEFKELYNAAIQVLPINTVRPMVQFDVNGDEMPPIIQFDILVPRTPRAQGISKEKFLWNKSYDAIIQKYIKDNNKKIISGPSISRESGMISIWKSASYIICDGDRYDLAKTSKAFADPFNQWDVVMGGD